MAERPPSPTTIGGAEDLDVELRRLHERPGYPQANGTKEPRRNRVLQCCCCVSILDVLVILAATVACTMSIMKTFESADFAALGLRMMAIAACVLLALERLTESSRFPCSCVKRFFPMLDYWIGRGLVHAFVAIQMRGVNLEGEDEQVHKLITWTSFAMLFVGLFFVAGGLMCFGQLERRHQQLAERAEEVRRELEVLEKRKKRLEREAGLV